MGYERDESYYDTKLPPKIIPDGWINLYWAVFGLVVPSVLNQNRGNVAELGCGPGAFAKLLWERMPNIKHYLGIDFSAKCLEIAQGQISSVEDFKFRKYNLVDDYKILKPLLEDYDAFISIEVLEHIQNDFEVLDLIPKGKTVILTGPNRNDESHVRWFESVGAFVDRYTPFIQLDFAGSMIANESGKMFFIIRGVKK